MPTLLNRDKWLFDPPALGTVLSLTGLPGGSSKIHDSSPYANHGTIIGSTWRRLPGGLWHLSLDGTDDYISVPHSSSLDITGPFTTKVWLYVVGTHDDNNYIFSKRGTYGYALILRASTRKIEGYVNNTSGSGDFDSNSAVPLSTWTQVGLTVDGKNMKHYLNGRLDKTTPCTPLPGANTVSLIIGCYNDLNSVFSFNGYVALPQIIRETVWNEFDFQNSFDQEKRLLGVC
jgi:hypothetical protein